ncbi:hypothetical protein RIF29_26608 [Crotalaria pallida]|uniref:Uncharacterized protein n=1 Tax=Crotalaria pallida TaxID=3830 RepID=A0AAN9EQ63_CROPI
MAFNISPLSSISLEWSSWNVRVRVLQSVIVYEVHDSTPNTVLIVLFVDAQVNIAEAMQLRIRMDELGFCDSFPRVVGSGRRTSVEDYFMCNYPHIMLSQLSSVNEIIQIRSGTRNPHTLRGKDICDEDSYGDIRRNLIPQFESVSKACNAPETDAEKEESSSDCAFNAGCSIPINTCDPHHVLYNFLPTP